ncbi:hypothetical protein JHN59_11535 [Streptomyces sp. MBT49]|uniref:hypothetical protein n=1 Tax=unclassified Streptomyces TaxID=2593676 RepID=UPI00190CF1A0|nr:MULTISPECIES: hypothetical protein [unclassified Streptomyces]MBK3625467.1 hypothetical protein [Streptomyces sp. MBT49]MBK3633270.1 hypothetical protein [Streptomyces sp. MBT97]
MALHVTGLRPADLTEVVDCLLLGSAACAETCPALSARRRELAHAIGDSLDTLPRPRLLHSTTDPAPAAV